MTPLLKSRQVAEMLGVSQPTLSRWRDSRTGPPWINVCGNPRYRATDIEAWINGQVQA